MDLLNDRKLVVAAVEALHELAKAKVKERKNKKSRQLFAENSCFNPREKINLVVSLIKIPKIPEDGKVKPLTLRSPIPHSFVDKKTNVLLVAKDLPSFRKDYDPTINHYKELLRRHGASNMITEVMTYRQIKIEYRDFECRRKFSNQFDIILCDFKILQAMPKLLGKHFYKSKKRAAKIKLNAKDLKQEITYALSKAFLHLNLEGSCGMAQIGRLNQANNEVADNILTVIQTLKKKLPGGWDNVRSINLKTDTSKSIPLYISTKSINDVPPVCHPYEQNEDEFIAVDTVSTLGNDDILVGVKKSGEIRTVKTNKSNTGNSTEEMDHSLVEDLLKEGKEKLYDEENDGEEELFKEEGKDGESLFDDQENETPFYNPATNQIMKWSFSKKKNKNIPIPMHKKKKLRRKARKFKTLMTSSKKIAETNAKGEEKRSAQKGVRKFKRKKGSAYKRRLIQSCV